MKTLSILAVLLLCGCANISHTRVVSETNGVRQVTEKESGRFFFQKEVAQKIGISTLDNGTNYSHIVTASGVQVTGDVQLIKAIGDAVAGGIGAAAKSAVKP